MTRLTPELAQRDPQAFIDTAAQHMVNTTELGGYLWNKGIETGTLKRERFKVNPNSWASFSNAGGRLILGAAPMSREERESLFFGGEAFTQEDVIARRLIHELGHGAFYIAQQDPHMRDLLDVTHDVRRRTGGREGYSAIGSHPYYETLSDKTHEDTADLLAMRAIGEDHLRGYLQFLANPQYAAVRRGIGVTHLATHHAVDYVQSKVEHALTEALNK